MDDRNSIKHSRKHKDGRASKDERSRYHHGKYDKFRGLRRKADRTTHHRRRQINSEELRKYGTEAQMLKSSTCVQKRPMSTRYIPSFPKCLEGRAGRAIKAGHTVKEICAYRPGLSRNRSKTLLKPYIN